MSHRTYTSSAAHSHRPIQGPSSTTATATQTITSAPVLRLRATGPAPAQARSSPRIRWAEDVVDNEGLGRKSSKVCCIYHAPRQVGESSSDESSSASSDDSSGDEADSNSSRSSDSDGGNDDGAARMSGSMRVRQARSRHRQRGLEEGDHQMAEGHICDGEAHDQTNGAVCERRRQKSKGKRRRNGNAYEKMPRNLRKKGAGSTTVVVESKVKG